MKYKNQSQFQKKRRLSEEDQKEFDESGDLTKKYFWQPINKRFTKYVVVIGEDPHRTFSFRCLLCEKNGREKIFEQSVSNESMSNYKRHLRTIHKIQPEKFKKGKRGVSQRIKTENDEESDDDENEDDNLALSILSKRLDVDNNEDKTQNEEGEGTEEVQGFENGFIGGS